MKDVIHHTYVCSYCGQEFADFIKCAQHERTEHYNEVNKDKLLCEPYFGRFFTYKDNGPCSVTVLRPYSYTYFDNGQLCLKCHSYSYVYDPYEDGCSSYDTAHMDVNFDYKFPLDEMSEMKEITEDEYKEFIMMALADNTNCLRYFE